MDEPKHAVEQAEQAISTHESIGHRTGAARSWRILADALARVDQADAAHAVRERATALTAELRRL